MPPASTVTIRRHQPVPRHPTAEDEALCDEAGRWGIYGQVVDQHVDADQHAITVVELDPSRPGARIALHGSVANSRNHALHDPEPA